MYKQNLWEKFGEQFSHIGKRFLIGMLSVLILGPFGVMIALSIAQHEKTYFVTNINIRTTTGENIPCAILKQKCYAYLPVFPFFCLFFYLPYKTDYYLIKNVSATNLKNRCQVYDTVLNFPIFNMEKITKSKCLAIQKDPQIIAEEITIQLEESKEKFDKSIQRFVDAGIATEIRSTYTYSIYRIKESPYSFHYSLFDGNPLGISITEKAVNGETDLNNVLEICLVLEPEKIINYFALLEDTVFERLSRNDKEENKENNALTQEALSEIEKSKKLLTKQVVERPLYKIASNHQLVGALLFLPALGAIELGIAGLVTGAIIIDFIVLPLGILLGYFFVKKILLGNKMRKDITKGNYKVIETKSENVSEKSIETDKGNIYTYDMNFKNRVSPENSNSIGVDGDTVYLVYSGFTKNVEACFNAVNYRLDPDLKIEKDIRIKNNNAEQTEPSKELPPFTSVCSACKKTINIDDRFCMHCGAVHQINK